MKSALENRIARLEKLILNSTKKDNHRRFTKSVTESKAGDILNDLVLAAQRVLEDASISDISTDSYRGTATVTGVDTIYDADDNEIEFKINVKLQLLDEDTVMVNAICYGDIIGPGGTEDVDGMARLVSRELHPDDVVAISNIVRQLVKHVYSFEY